MEYQIKPLRPDETGLLADFLYEAIFLPEGSPAPPRSILAKPELQVYLEHWGKPDDYCLVAEWNGRVVGAVWTRIMHDYGHVDEETPSFVISLLPPYRHRGIGTALMRAMLLLLKEQGYRRASLSVQKANYAVRMYQAVGFQIIGENADEYLMLCKL